MVNAEQTTGRRKLQLLSPLMNNHNQKFDSRFRKTSQIAECFAQRKCPNGSFLSCSAKRKPSDLRDQQPIFFVFSTAHHWSILRQNFGKFLQHLFAFVEFSPVFSIKIWTCKIAFLGGFFSVINSSIASAESVCGNYFQSKCTSFSKFTNFPWFL